MTRVTPILLIALGLQSALGAVLYETDFESFPVGNNAWAGFDDWISNDLTSGVQAIDEGLFSGALGKTAALGFNQPANPFTIVLRPINYDPAVGGESLIEFQMLFGIEDSTSLTNFNRDNFFFSFYNIAGDLLATIRISNVDTEFGFWRQDGSPSTGGAEYPTGQDFVHGELYNLSGIIDLESNRWTAAINGLLLFENEIFNATGLERTIGLVGVEWEIALGDPAEYGDNWMLIADLRLETAGNPPPPVEIESISRTAAGDLRLSWQATPGYTYLVEHSDNLVNWQSGLPNSVFPEPSSTQLLEFVDITASEAEGRYYRIRRTNVP